MPNISLIMIVKNEEKVLPSCLKSVRGIIKDIIIADTGSTDKTREVAKSFGAKVYDFKWINDFSAARNYALSKSNSDWNLVLDADEQVTSWDKDKINSLLKEESIIGKIKINNKFKQNGEDRYSHTFISRLLPKEVFYTGKIHEQVDSDLPRVELPIEVFHTGYYETDKSERNLSILKAELSKNPFNAYISYQLARQYKTINQIQEANAFFKESYTNVNREEGYFTDLIVNYLYTLTDLKHYKIALDVINREKMFLETSPDFHFVCGVFYMNFVLSNVNQNIQYLPLIEKSYLKCLDLGEKGEREIVLGTSTFLTAYNLGVYYEMFKQIEKAKYFYEFSASFNYEPAKKRLINLSY